MPAPDLKQNIQEIPLTIVGGNKFGRYPKISDEETFNFIVSDDWLVPYAGYKAKITASPALVGRGLYASTPGNIMIAVIGEFVYAIGSNLLAGIPVGTLGTTTGDVYMAENNAAQICITDGSFVYIYNWSDGSFKTSIQSGSPSSNQFLFAFSNPGYVAFQNGRFIIACLNSQLWVLSALNNGTDWPTANDAPNASRIGTIQSKPGFIQAPVPVPGGGNNIFIFGSNVIESWTDLGLALFPYQRNSTLNVDYGCLNAASISAMDNFVVWLGVNEQSGPVVMYAQGNQIKSVSTDGIDFKLSQLTNPSNCTGFLFRQDGHLIYQFTFITDNLSYAYDFNSGLFFTVTDENLNYHIAREVVFFNNYYYFVSLNGGNVYRFGTQYTDAIYSVADNTDSHEIPRLRVLPPLRLPSQRYFIAKSLGFTIENGQPNRITTITKEIFGNETLLDTESQLNIATENNYLIAVESDSDPTDIITYEIASEAVDLSISRDGGESFGASLRLNMNHVGKRKSRFIFQRLGIVNDCTFQLRFSGFGRFTCTNGQVEIYQ